jgi:serine/threonine protein kinase
MEASLNTKLSIAPSSLIGNMEASAGCERFPPRQFQAQLDCRSMLETRYRIYGILGEKSGGGIVYDAYDTETGETVALKVIPYNIPNPEVANICLIQSLRVMSPVFLEFKGWFMCGRPPAAWAKLRDPPPILKADWDANQLVYYAMEKADAALNGFNIASLTPYDRIAFVFELFYGVDILHRADLTHNDPKPDNILVGRSMPRVYIINGVSYYVKSPFLPKIADYGDVGPGNPEEDSYRFIGSIGIVFPDLYDELIEIFQYSTNLILGLTQIPVFDVLKLDTGIVVSEIVPHYSINI